jgi:aerobic-type carbon monoxide dehydrogenase small subunit (CoxS/CutS family)
MADIRLRVNGREHALDLDPGLPLVWVLRDVLGLTGTKPACEAGLCGACTVHLDGVPERSCVTRVGDVSGRHITTIEALSPTATHPLQQAWLAERVTQCGWCQPGQLMRAAALLASHPHPSDAQIDEAMADNLCRCGTYPRIRRAIRRAASGGAR